MPSAFEALPGVAASSEPHAVSEGRAASASDSASKRASVVRPRVLHDAKGVSAIAHVERADKRRPVAFQIVVVAHIALDYLEFESAFAFGGCRDVSLRKRRGVDDRSVFACSGRSIESGGRHGGDLVGGSIGRAVCIRGAARVSSRARHGFVDIGSERQTAVLGSVQGNRRCLFESGGYRRIFRDVFHGVETVGDEIHFCIAAAFNRHATAIISIGGIHVNGDGTFPLNKLASHRPVGSERQVAVIRLLQRNVDLTMRAGNSNEEVLVIVVFAAVSNDVGVALFGIVIKRYGCIVGIRL